MIWEEKFQQNIIVSMKYIGFNEEGSLIKRNKDDLLFCCSDLIFSLEDEILDLKNIPFYVETEYSKNSQIENITELIKSAYKIIQNQNCKKN